MRKLPAIVAVAVMLTTLSACAGSPFDAACTPAFSTGSNTSLVTAEGRFGDDPEASFPTPLVGSGTEVSILDAGDGIVVDNSAIVDFQVTAYNAATGDVFTASSYDPAEPVRRTAAPGADVLGEVLACSTVGSRVISTTTADTLFSPDRLTEFGLNATDFLVLVLDVSNTYLGKANGADQPAQAGLPSIVLAPNGQPGFTFSSDPAPTDLVIANLKSGSGAVVEKGDRVVVHYTGALWDSRSIFDSSWERGAPATFVAESVDTAEGGVVDGLATALIGQKVGSQVIAVIPPEFGYAAGTAPTSIPDGATMIWVIDILGIE